MMKVIKTLGKIVLALLAVIVVLFGLISSTTLNMVVIPALLLRWGATATD